MNYHKCDVNVGLNELDSLEIYNVGDAIVCGGACLFAVGAGAGFAAAALADYLNGGFND
ncbi:MAG: hypothetical protein AAF250_08930 [Pseudomonadota bacterium]